MDALNLYRHFISTLQPIYGPGESEAITKIVFEDLAGMTRSELLLMRDRPVSPETETQMIKALEELTQHRPVQYITGRAWFCGFPFLVNSAVLIPRPETEELVERAITLLNGKKHVSVIDIGTGSGCIAISISKKNPVASVTAIDKSPEALKVAAFNAKELNARVIFVEIDFLDEKTWDTLEKYDCIISNPPYIPAGEAAQMDRQVTEYEPGIALFVPDNRPLIFYEKILAFGKEHLKPGGIILMETHERLAADVCNLFKRHGYQAVVITDVFGKERMVEATPNP